MSTLHFRCSFDVSARKAGDAWGNLLRTVRNWIGERPNPVEDNDFYTGWFFRGGRWKSKRDPRRRVLTCACYGSATEENSNCWAVEYEHPCQEFPGCRTWRTHVGVEQFDSNRLHFNLQTLYDIKPGFIGLPPKEPVPSPPGPVTTLLTSDYWECTAGSEKLALAPRVLRVGEGNVFVELLTSEQRTCPVVLVSHPYPDLGYLIDPRELARLLAGTAIVVQSETSEVDKELEYLLGPQFSCWNGMIRIYAPHVDFQRAGDDKRHRYILKNHIEVWGIDTTKQIIVTGLARRGTRLRGILTPLDVESCIRHRRLAQLRAERSDTSNAEWVGVLEEDNKALNVDNNKLKEEIQSLEDRLEECADDTRRLEYENKSLNFNLGQIRGSTSGGCGVEILDSLRELPKTLGQVISTIGRLHGGRIVFTDQAVRSAEETEFRDVNTAWKALWAMATTLYDVFFEEEGGNPEKKFRDRTGFPLALTEGKLTKKTSKLRAQRKDTFMGEEIDITPHVKFDDDTTRAYFCPFSKNGISKIVVGFVGHLDTAGTRRRKD